MGRFVNMAMFTTPRYGGTTNINISKTYTSQASAPMFGGGNGLFAVGGFLFGLLAGRGGIRGQQQITSNYSNQYAAGNDAQKVNDDLANLNKLHSGYTWIHDASSGDYIGQDKDGNQIKGKTFAEANQAALDAKAGKSNGAANPNETVTNADEFTIKEAQNSIQKDMKDYISITDDGKIKTPEIGADGKLKTDESGNIVYRELARTPENLRDAEDAVRNAITPKSTTGGDSGIARTKADADKAIADAGVKLPDGFELEVVQDGDGWTYKLVKKSDSPDAKLPSGINASYGDPKQLIDALKQAGLTKTNSPVEDDGQGDGEFQTPTTKNDAIKVIDANLGKPFTVHDASGKTSDITGTLSKDGNNYVVTTASGNKYTFQVNDDGTAEIISLNGKPTKKDVYHVNENGLIQNNGDAGYGSGIRLQDDGRGAVGGSGKTPSVKNATAKAKSDPTVLQLVKGTKDGKPYYTVHTPDGKKYDGTSEAEVQDKLKNAGYQNVKLEQAGRNGFGTGGNKVISRGQTGPYARTAEEKKKPMTIRYIVDLNGAMRSNNGKGIKIFTPDGSSFFAVGKDIASAKAEMQKLLKQAGWTNVTLTGKTDADFS